MVTECWRARRSTATACAPTRRARRGPCAPSTTPGFELPARFWIPDLLEDYARIVDERGGEPTDQYRRTQELVARIADVLPLTDPAPCHNDLLPGNILAADADPGHALLVDWEYAGMGHPCFDLGNLAVNNAFDEAAQDRLLEAYFDEPPSRARRAALRLMMLVSDAREAAWGVVQGIHLRARLRLRRLRRPALLPARAQCRRPTTPGVDECRDPVTFPTARAW